MSAMRAIMWKEVRIFLREKRASGALILTVLFVTVFTSWQVGSVGLVVGPLTAVFAGAYLLTWVAFNEERLNKTLPSLLGAPLGIWELFLGKIVAVFIATYAVGLLGSATAGMIVWFRFGQLPSSSVIVATFVTIPIYGIVLSELLGLVYLLFGNPFILRLFMIFILVIILNPALKGHSHFHYFSTMLIPIGIGVMVVLFFLATRIDKERVTRR